MERWVVGILIKNGSILIGELKRKEMKLPRMTWFFPYTKIDEDESPRLKVKQLFKSIGIEAKISRYLLTSTPSENPNLELLYYELKYVRGIQKPGLNFSKFIWIRPTQAFQYFTHMIDVRISDYLKMLEVEPFANRYIT